jgi:N-acetylmuramoyl-L-alanine amidase/putative methionine-R-sulfoxide reductase with GAF domain
MSATANNAEAGWTGSLAGPLNLDAEASDESGAGRDALQGLLAFACIHEQAAKRRQAKSSPDRSTISKDEEFGLDEVLRLVAARAVSITGADGVAIALAEDEAIVCRASVGQIAPDPGIRLDPNSGFSGACLRSGQTVRCDDSDADARVNAQACRALGTRSMIAVPLSAKQRIVGLIEAFSSETYGFNDSDVRSLNLLGELILAAIRPEEEDRLAELATSIVPVATPVQSREAIEDTAHPAVPSAKVLVDEKVVPKPEATVAPTEEAQHDAPAVLVPTSNLEAPGSLPRVSLGTGSRSFSGILLTAALVLVVIGLGSALSWRIRQIKHMEQSISANTQAVRPSARMETPEPSPSSPAPRPGSTPQVTGISHWSSAESSTVVVDVEDQVQYETHSLDNPTRIYFDLHDTKMTAGLFNQSIDINDGFLKRIRMAQPTENVTRVVLETKGELEFSVKLDSNPYRLTIEVHKPAASATTKPISLSKPSPAVELLPKRLSHQALLSPADFRIVLDAGHGGWDLGTIGKKGLLEKDLVLDIVNRLGQLVENKLAAQVIYTRQDDSYLPLEKRAEIANLAKADLFLSVHANYSDLATARGIETYYTNTYSSIKARTADSSVAIKNIDWTGIDIREKVSGSRRFAADVQQALYGGLVARNPDIRNRGVKQAQYVVLTGTQMPAVLAEVSFVSSPDDENKLQRSEYRQLIAESLFKGLTKYCEESKHTKVATARN